MHALREGVNSIEYKVPRIDWSTLPAPTDLDPMGRVLPAPSLPATPDPSEGTPMLRLDGEALTLCWPDGRALTRDLERLCPSE